MKKLLKKLTLTFSLIAATIGFSAALRPAASYAGVDCSGISDPAELTRCEQKRDVCDGAEAAGVTNCGDSTQATSSFKGIIKTVINILSVVVGAVSVIMIIIGGFRYVISNGDSNGLQGAKNTILYAIVGLVVVLFAQIIVAFVIDRATTPPAEDTTTSTPAQNA